MFERRLLGTKWLWSTNADLLSGDALTVLKAEQCILAIRGHPIVELTNQSTRLDAPARGHSAKPPEFYDLVESLCPAPRYADLFSRYRHNKRWDCHGDEAPASYDPLDDINKSAPRPRLPTGIKSSRPSQRAEGLVCRARISPQSPSK